MSDFDIIAHLERERKWSEYTFGSGPRTKRILSHIRSELKEIEAHPNDLREWIDVVTLALDGAWRAGFTSQDVIAALVDKQCENEHREWREAAPDEPVEHVRQKECICPPDLPFHLAGCPVRRY